MPRPIAQAKGSEMLNRVAFVGGKLGDWRVVSMASVCGASIEPVASIAIVRPGSGLPAPAPASAWVLEGQTSNIRYATRVEATSLRQRQESLGRPEARRAALIPIKKSSAWWDLAQDERRAIFEEHSHHTAIGLDYLPAVARQLYHCRDLGQPFDFLTWFEYAAEHAQDFEELVVRLRASMEWTFVEREIDIRLELRG